MRTVTVVLGFALAILGCADAPTEVGSVRKEGAFYPTPSFAITPGGQILQVAIPSVGAVLLPDELLVATGRTDGVDINECEGILFSAARYGALASADHAEGYRKMHFSADIGPGTRMSKFQYVTTCTNAGVQYFVYDVETQTPPSEVVGSGEYLYVVIPSVGSSLLPDAFLVATGRTASIDISDCDGFPVTAARYGALTGPDAYSKLHFLTDVPAGTRMSNFEHSNSCFTGGVQYEVYFVTTQ